MKDNNKQYWVQPDGTKIPVETTGNKSASVMGSAPLWYTREDLHRYLKAHQYSDTIAKELADDYGKNLQLAFEKGYSKGLNDKA